jgi:hypothetical protein
VVQLNLEVAWRQGRIETDLHGHRFFFRFDGAADPVAPSKD